MNSATVEAVPDSPRLYRVVLTVPGVGVFHRKPSSTRAKAQTIADMFHGKSPIGLFLGVEWKKQ